MFPLLLRVFPDWAGGSISGSRYEGAFTRDLTRRKAFFAMLKAIREKDILPGAWFVARTGPHSVVGMAAHMPGPLATFSKHLFCADGEPLEEYDSLWILPHPFLVPVGTPALYRNPKDKPAGPGCLIVNDAVRLAAKFVDYRSRRVTLNLSNGDIAYFIYPKPHKFFSKWRLYSRLTKASQPVLALEIDMDAQRRPHYVAASGQPARM